MSNHHITNDAFISVITAHLPVNTQIMLVKQIMRQMTGKDVMDFLNSVPVKVWAARNITAINQSSGNKGLLR